MTEENKSSALKDFNIIGRGYVFKNVQTKEKLILIASNQEEFKIKATKLLGDDWVYFESDTNLPVI